jgi:hypothetical protein
MQYDLEPDDAFQVLEYCDHHQTDPLPTGDEPSADESRKRTTDISEWDQKFISVDQEMLFEIILAANYLDIKPLLCVLAHLPHSCQAPQAPPLDSHFGVNILSRL